MLDASRPTEEHEHGPGRVCECGHTRSAHMGTGNCLAVHSKTGKAEGKVRQGSICPCREFRP